MFAGATSSACAAVAIAAVARAAVRSSPTTMGVKPGHLRKLASRLLGGRNA